MANRNLDKQFDTGPNSSFPRRRLFRNCHSEAKPRNLVFMSGREDEILRCTQDDSNRTFANCDTGSRWGRTRAAVGTRTLAR